MSTTPAYHSNTSNTSHKLIQTTHSPFDLCSAMSGNKSEPTIGVDVFKELINDMTQQLNTNLNNLNTKVDNITNRLNSQDLRINDLGQRVETLEKHLTYAEAAKTPPQPTKPTNTNTNTETNTNANTNKTVTEIKMTISHLKK